MGYFMIRGAKKFPSFSSRGRKDSFSSDRESLRDTLLDDNNWAGGGRRTAVPKGYLAVYVGEGMRRFVIPTSYLCLPLFRELMERVAEEFGFEQEGGLRIPCNEADFIEILEILATKSAANKNKKKEERKRSNH